MNDVAPRKYGMGARVRRKEDKALVTGAGHFTDDYTPEGTLRAYVLRSSMGHARIKLGDLSAVQAMPGVRLVMTHADLGGVKGLPCKGKIRQVDGTHPRMPEHPLLCGDVVRHVGDPIVFMVADTLDQAKAASEAIEVDYDPLPAVTDMRAALEEGAPVVWPEYREQRCLHLRQGRQGRHRRGDAQGGKGLPHRDRQQPPRRQLHGDARHRRRIRRGEGPLHPDPRHPGRPRHARSHRQGHPRHSGEQGQGNHPGCRRRLWHQVLRLSGVSAGGSCREAAGQASEVDRRPERAFPCRRPWPRQFRCRRDGDGRERAVPRHARRSPRQYGRLPVAIRAVHPGGRPDDDDGALRHPAPLCALPGHLHQHSAGRRLSRRRAAGGGLPGRAAGRPVRTRYGPRAGRDPPTQLHPARGAALRDAGRAHLRQRRVRRSSGAGAGNLGLAGLRRAGRGGKGDGQAPRLRHRHLRRGLRFPRQGRSDRPPWGGRQGDALHRHPDQRPGPRHRLRPVHRRPSRARLRQGRCGPGRHRPGAEWRRYRRLALDAARRGVGPQRRGQARPPGQDARLRPARGGGRRSRTRRRHGPRRRHQPRRDARRCRQVGSRTRRR